MQRSSQLCRALDPLGALALSAQHVRAVAEHPFVLASAKARNLPQHFGIRDALDGSQPQLGEAPEHRDFAQPTVAVQAREPLQRERPVGDVAQCGRPHARRIVR